MKLSKKIIIFSPYYPPHIGGLESHADEFNKYLSPHIKRIVVFTPHLPQDTPQKELKYGNVEIIRFPAFEIIPNYPVPKFWLLKFWKLFLDLFKNDYDLVISRTRFFLTSLLALIFAKTKRRKWIHIEHGSDFVRLNNYWKSNIAKIYDHTLGCLTIRMADQVIANSQASAIFCQKLCQRKINIIHRGVEIKQIERINPKNLKSSKIKICYLGRLIDGKGVKDLLAAIFEIKFQNWELHIIGDGPQRNFLEKLSYKFKIDKKTHFWGYQKFESAISILKACDIIVNPSYTEGLPTSIIEAALCQKAIIATDVGGTREIITNKKSGFLIAPKNEKVLKEKLTLLVENEDLRNRFGKNSFNEAKNKFSWNSNILKYLDIFE
jgi:glycosyltransferase involved in cell wall biosynthesis